jgi:hypothetical protein
MKHPNPVRMSETFAFEGDFLRRLVLHDQRAMIEEVGRVRGKEIWNKRVWGMQTPMMLASAAGHTTLLRWMVDQGANPIPDRLSVNEGSGVLEPLLERDDAETLAFLLERFPDLHPVFSSLVLEDYTVPERVNFNVTEPALPRRENMARWLGEVTYKPRFYTGMRSGRQGQWLDVMVGWVAEGRLRPDTARALLAPWCKADEREPGEQGSPLEAALLKAWPLWVASDRMDGLFWLQEAGLVPDLATAPPEQDPLLCAIRTRAVRSMVHLADQPDFVAAFQQHQSRLDDALDGFFKTESKPQDGDPERRLGFLMETLGKTIPAALSPDANNRTPPVFLKTITGSQPDYLVRVMVDVLGKMPQDEAVSLLGSRTPCGTSFLEALCLRTESMPNRDKDSLRARLKPLEENLALSQQLPEARGPAPTRRL